MRINWKVVWRLIVILFVASFLAWLCYIWLPFSPPKIKEADTSADWCTKMTDLPLTGANFSISPLGQGKSEYIGVSDGSFIFDTSRETNRELKCQGAIQFRQGESRNAGSDWTQAVVLQNHVGFQQQDSNDAEALIYRENNTVLHSGLPYITFIVATILTGQDNGIGYDTLQGAYAAQEEFNNTYNDIYHHPLQIQLLVANFSSDVLENPNSDASEQTEYTVTQTIITMAKNLKVKGIVIGLPFTFNKAITLLNASGIPTALSGAFSNSQLLNTNSIFPIAASTEHEGQEGALYVQQFLQASKIALFVNPASPYSSSLANAFKNAVGQGNIVATEKYVGRDAGGNGTIAQGVRKALQQGIQLIYFAGDLLDADVALSILEQSNSNVEFMGGDAIYELSNYIGKHYKSLYFTSSAFPDEWKQLYAQQDQPLPTIYRLLYAGWSANKVYGYVRPDNNAILAYDALSILQQAGYTVFSNATYSVSFTSDKLRETLKQTTFQGFSGRISFSDSAQNTKLVLVLHVTANGLTQMVEHYGCLLITCNAV